MKICAGQSGTTDTLCFPVPVIQKILIAAEQKKLADSLLKIAERQVLQLEKTIDLLSQKEIELTRMYEDQIANLNQQIALYKDQINGYEKLLRKERFKRKLITGAGIIATAGALLLTLKK